MPDMAPYKFSAREVTEFPQIIWLLPLFSVAHWKLMVKTPVAEDTEHFGHMTNQAEA